MFLVLNLGRIVTLIYCEFNCVSDYFNATSGKSLLKVYSENSRTIEDALLFLLSSMNRYLHAAKTLFEIHSISIKYQRHT